MKKVLPAIIYILLLCIPSPADIIHVPGDFATIQSGINAAVDGDTVLVADGTYTGDGNRNISFGGRAITVRSENGPENCVIDVSDVGADHRVFVFHSGEGHDSVLEGFTITGGEGEYEGAWGGGIHCDGSSPTIRGNIITGNTSWVGAGICCWIGSQPIIEGNVITANQMLYSMKPGSWGGGIFIYQAGLVVIRDNVISSNIPDLWAMGCAVYAEGSTIEMINNLVIHNGVNDAGYDPYESLRFADCQVLIRNLTLADNQISHRGALGLSNSTATIENSIISNNFDTQIYIHESDCTVRYSNIRDGWAGEGNIDNDSLFVSGPQSDYYLSQTAAGQAVDSPCVDSGDPQSAIFDGTTRSDLVQDLFVIDMGYHHPAEASSRLVAGPGPSTANPPLVRLFLPVQDAEPSFDFPAYGAIQYGVNVATGKIDNDGRDKIITGAGPGEIYGPHVRGFQMDGSPLPGLDFLAYGTNRYGVNVAAGDLDADGYDEIITGAGPGAVFGPHVRGWNYDGSGAVSAMAGVNYFAYGTPRWGVNVSAGDIDGDGFDEIVTGAGPGAVYGPHVRGWDIDGSAATAIPGVSFMAYGLNHYGVTVTCGDVDGDGVEEIVTGPGPGAVFPAHIRGWNYDGAALSALAGLSFFAFDHQTVRYGANVFAGADLNQDGRDELVMGAGPDPDVGTPVIVYTYDGSQVSLWFSLEAFEGMTHGTTVAAGIF